MNTITSRKRAAYSKFRIASGTCTEHCCSKVRLTHGASNFNGFASEWFTTFSLFRNNIFHYFYQFEGGMYLPRSDSGRIIVGTWWLVVLVVVTTYCGNLVAFLTFPKMEISVNTVGQLVNQKHGFTWSIRSNTYLESYLKVSLPRTETNQLFFFKRKKNRKWKTWMRINHLFIFVKEKNKNNG